MASTKKPAAKKPRAKTTKTKPKAAKAKKPSTRKAKDTAPARGVGDNSKINQPLVENFEEYALLDEQKKAIGKQQRSLRAAAKDQHGVSSKVYMHQVMLRKLDPATRVEFEHGCNELNGQLGYQFSLELLTGGEGGEGGEGFAGYEEEEDTTGGAGGEEEEDEEEAA